MFSHHVTAHLKLHNFILSLKLSLLLGRTIFNFPISFSFAGFGVRIYLEFAVNVSLQEGKTEKLFELHGGCLYLI